MMPSSRSGTRSASSTIPTTDRDGDAVDEHGGLGGQPVADLGGCLAVRGQQRAGCLLRLAPLPPGAGEVGVQTATPWPPVPREAKQRQRLPCRLG
jgi:hypothetical protein